MNKLLSIVIPVYKVEEFIDKCISSLILPDEKQPSRGGCKNVL